VENLEPKLDVTILRTMHSLFQIWDLEDDKFNTKTPKVDAQFATSPSTRRYSAYLRIDNVGFAAEEKKLQPRIVNSM